jgi:tRNA dimethylallyltransferase
VGKTAVAAALAALRPVTIISADARQVYRDLNVGTAKPEQELLRRVSHRGLDLIDPGERYSAGRFAREAAVWVEDAIRARRPPVIVGGTGFYVRALADGLFREPSLEPARRERLREWAARLPGPALARWGARLDPRYAGGGRQRTARVIEMALLTGRALSWWQQHARDRGVLDPWYIHLTLPRDLLHRRIADRVDRMLAAGLVDEVRTLLARGVSGTAPGLDAVGYREVVAHLDGRIPASELRAAIILATRRYAKRQETWFRNQLKRSTAGTQPSTNGTWREVWKIDATKPAEDIATMVEARWASLTDGADR